MKLIKELPKSIYYSALLRSNSLETLSNNKKKLPVIVSIASIPERLHTIDIAIKSIFNQTNVIPEKIVLCLHKSLQNKLPKRLLKLQGNFLEIEFTELTCSHRKLINPLKKYPNKNIVTCDDDVIYGNNFLETLYRFHLENPKCIISNKTKQITLDKDGNFLPYKYWKISIHNFENKNDFFPVGVGGVLYPPDAMPDIVFNVDLFQKLCPNADDIWFKSMALLNGIHTIHSGQKVRKPIPIIGSQKKALKKQNVSENKNDVQWKAVSNFFNLKELLQPSK